MAKGEPFGQHLVDPKVICSITNDYCRMYDGLFKDKPKDLCRGCPVPIIPDYTQTER